MKKSASNKCGEMILKKVLDENPAELAAKNPMILSCGGVYIPQRERDSRPLPYHILNTPSDSEPVKVVSGTRPMNILHRVIVRESMN
jgi:hypothetical protein|tara:strand:- start:97 stop:357 length:261 start_codon:yes stop_codon:yes gene_type:complete